MTGEPRSLQQLVDAGFDLTISCRRCRRRVVVPGHRALSLFRAMGWPTDWRLLSRRFRCARCGLADRVRVGGSLRLPGEPSGPAEPSPINTIAPPPRGTKARHWYGADDAERRRIVRRLRS